MSRNDTPDFGDPYELLGLKDVVGGAPILDSDVQKAFRKQSLQYHPDKQGGKSETEKLAIAQRFHKLHQAKEFLLDPKKRQPFDAQRASRKRRQEHDQQRENHLTDRRRRMQQELVDREAKARGEEGGMKRGQSNKDTTIHLSKKQHEKYSSSSLNDDGWLQQLRKDGLRRREEFATKVDIENRRRVRRQESTDAFQISQRRLRLKWSRKRISFSPTEKSIAALLQYQFGKVENVEILGAKGNQALITFESEDSCQPCIDFYAHHSEIRAFPLMDEDVEVNSIPQQQQQQSHQSVAETDEEYAIRRSREREELQRQMEQDDGMGNDINISDSKIQDKKQVVKTPFPLDFPKIENDTTMTPFDKLQYFERLIWGKFLSPNQVDEMQI
jgi:curved DNA-binding protein CbpA